VYTLKTGRGIKVIYIYIYIYTYYLIVMCIDGKKYITDNEPQRDTKISVNNKMYSYFSVRPLAFVFVYAIP
jgi:hypothetical protein